MRRRCVARGSSVWYTRCPKPEIFCFFANISFTYSTGSAFAFIDRIQQVHRRLVRPAMQRSLQRPDRPCDRRMQVRQRRRNHARRERACVQFMVRMQDQRDVERLASPCLKASRRSASTEKFAACDSALVRLDDLPCLCGYGRTAPPASLICAVSRKLLRTFACVRRRVLLIRVIDADSSETAVRSTSIGEAVFGTSTSANFEHRRRIDRPAPRASSLVKAASCSVGRQRAIPQQVRRLFKGAFARQFMNIDPAVRQDTGVAIDVADRRSRGNNTL